MGIPPHAARLAGTWPVHAGRWAPAPSTEAATQRRDRSRRGVGVVLQPARWASRTSATASVSSRPA